MSPVRRRAIAAAALGVYVLLLAVALLAPTSGTQSHMASWATDVATAFGVPANWATQARAELVCNALIVAPVSLAGSALWPRTSWRGWTAWTFVAACAVELTQGVLLPGRTPSYDDIVANTLGGLLGALVWWAARQLQVVGERPPRAE